MIVKTVNDCALLLKYDRVAAAAASSLHGAADFREVSAELEPDAGKSGYNRQRQHGAKQRVFDGCSAVHVADEGSKAWRDAGLGYLRMDDAELAERLLADQRLLRLPQLAVGSRMPTPRKVMLASRMMFVAMIRLP